MFAGFEGHRGWIYRLAVDPDHQKQGLGSALLKAAENWLKTDQNIARIQLMVRAENAEILSFYKDHGYTQSDIVMLWKDLENSGVKV